MRIVLIPLTQLPSGPTAGPARASPRDGWPRELISCCARQMNCFGRKYQRSLRVVRHKGCWILKSCFQHPLQGCRFGAATAFEMSPARWSMVGVLFFPSSPTFGNTGTGNESKAAEMWEPASLPCWELRAHAGIVHAFGWLRCRCLLLA